MKFRSEALTKVTYFADSSQHKKSPFPHTYVLKTYRTVDAEQYYKNEVQAFLRLRTDGKPERSVVEFFGSFLHGDTYNIILEYADKGTLEDYFQDPNTIRPSNGRDILSFWDQFTRLFNGLKTIHEPPEHGSKGPQIFRG